MADNQQVVIAGSNFLANLGLRHILKSVKGFVLSGECTEGSKLYEFILAKSPDLLIINYADAGFGLEQLKKVSLYFPEIKILAITPPQQRSVVSIALASGILSHLLNDCGKDEIIEALISTSRGEKFFCGKILEHVMNDNNQVVAQEGISCDGFRISAREAEIIRLVAEGLTNKQIADKLFLSAHTIMTHRKNIMNKVGVNNTAGLVFFAIKNGIISPNKFLFSQPGS